MKEKIKLKLFKLKRDILRGWREGTTIVQY